MALPDVAYRLIGWFSTTRFDRFLHPLLYRRARGRGITGRVLGADSILLTTTGRRSGEPRTVALFAFPSDGGWIVVGSRGGSGRVPDWAHNLQADPRATLRLRAREAPALAHELRGNDYDAAFELAAAAYPGYRLYRRNARHHIPIFRLVPAPAPVPAPVPGAAPVAEVSPVAAPATSPKPAP
jgi:deazaflavin-dependent oxidoreductase (nitroreductase family)